MVVVVPVFVMCMPHVLRHQFTYLAGPHSSKALASVKTDQKTMALRLQRESRNIKKNAETISTYLHRRHVNT